MVTSTSRVIRPDAVTEATPLMPSYAGISVSSTYFESSYTSMPSRDTETMDTGSMSGLIFMIAGAPTESLHPAESMEISELISIIAVFRSAVSLNSSTTSDRLSLDFEEMFLMSVSVANDDSSGRVTSVSTCSGVAPTYVVYTMTYGKFMLGSRSVVIFVNEITPSTITRMTPTITVYGFFTLYFPSMLPTSERAQLYSNFILHLEHEPNIKASARRKNSPGDPCTAAAARPRASLSGDRLYRKSILWYNHERILLRNRTFGGLNLKKNIVMPRLREEMRSGVLCAWLKEEGEAYQKGEPIFEIETDKVVNQVEAAADGVMLRQLVEEGDEVPAEAAVAEVEE